jgi:hypothetical protein
MIKSELIARLATLTLGGGGNPDCPTATTQNDITSIRSSELIDARMVLMRWIAIARWRLPVNFRERVDPAMSNSIIG